MLTLKREDKTVKVVIDTDLPHEEGGDTLYNLTYTAGSTQEAELLLRYFQQRFSDRIRSIRKQEFMSGWRHGRAKKRGKSWFGHFFGSLNDKASHNY